MKLRGVLGTPDGCAALRGPEQVRELGREKSYELQKGEMQHSESGKEWTWTICFVR